MPRALQLLVLRRAVCGDIQPKNIPCYMHMQYSTLPRREAVYQDLKANSIPWPARECKRKGVAMLIMTHSLHLTGSFHQNKLFFILN